MKQIDLQEEKAIELNILKYIDRVCRENDIRYYIVGGTLIGAVRHKGFIPWDDDIDIAMTRGEFDRFLKACKKDTESPYQVLWFTNTRNYGYPFPKIIDKRTTLIDYKRGSAKESIGVFIDIFLCEGLGNNYFWSKVYFYLTRIQKRMVFLSRRNYQMENPVKTIVFFIPLVVCKLVGTDRINKIYYRMCGKYSFDDSKYVGNLAGAYGIKEIVSKSYFSGVIDLPFEGTKVMAPKGWDLYLKHIYGNYMQLPPEEKRIMPHVTDVWWND